jgi:hypothetical protein
VVVFVGVVDQMVDLRHLRHIQDARAQREIVRVHRSDGVHRVVTVFE